MARVRTAAWGTLVLFLVCSCGAPERTPVASARVAVDPAPEPAPAAVDVAAPFDRACRESEGRIEAVATSIDATSVGAERPGLRTLTNALHHFRPEEAGRILQSAVDARQPIAVFEMVGRHPAQILGMLLVFIPVLLVVPFLRPFRWAWVPLTYLVPVIPLFVMWDGLVSCLRVYSETELRTLIDGLEGSDAFAWEIGEIAMPGVPVGIGYLVGTPRAA